MKALSDVHVTFNRFTKARESDLVKRSFSIQINSFIVGDNEQIYKCT